MGELNMTKKDYEMIAAILKSYRGEIPAGKLDDMVEVFAHQLASRNAQFNHTRFIAATKR